MSPDSTLVNGRPLEDMVRRIIAEVLIIGPEDVQPGKALVRDLGAESIDFMDLVFRLEEELGTRIPFPRWQRFIEQNFRGHDLAAVITPAVVQRFAEQEIAAS